MSEVHAIEPSGDKSITHRAFLIAGSGRSSVEIRHPLTSADTRSTARVLRQLGVRVSPMRHSHPVRVSGAKWTAPRATLNCGNSGTTARLLLGTLAGHRFEARVDGDSSLRGRPMRRVTHPLIEMGAQITEERGDSLPLSIRGGGLRSIVHESPVASAQVKSAVLLAGLTAGVPVVVSEPVLSRDHTERLLRFLGAEISTTGTKVELGISQDLLGGIGDFDLDVPGDPSAAAFLLASVIIGGTRELAVRRVCVNPTRTGFLDVLDRMGAQICMENEVESGGEPVADLIVRPSQLQGTEVLAHEIPSLIDEVPVLAALASRAAGETVFRSVGELRVKESDRLTSIAENLRHIGVEADVSGDDLHIAGSDRPLRGRVETQGDHRISMAFSVLGSVPMADLELSETASTGISYPRFFEDLHAVRGNG